MQAGLPAPQNQREQDLASGGCGAQRARNAREYGGNAGGDPWHDRASGNGYETGHQGVLDQVLAAIIRPDL